MNRRHQILILGTVFCTGILMIVAGAVTLMNDSDLTVTPVAGEIRAEQPARENIQVIDPGSGIFLSAVDRTTGKPLGGVLVYLDGGYTGTTSAGGPVGILNITPVSVGQHTIRVTKPGFSEETVSLTVPSVSPVTISLEEQLLVPVRETGLHSAKIDIVFVPSGTSYNCALRKKISTTSYVTDRRAFVTDVNRFVNDGLFTLDTVTDRTAPIPADYRDRFNIYYYYDPSEFADAFNGCAGKAPEKFWRTVPFADIVIILYPSYYTPHTGAPCEPNGCVSPGTGRSWMKTPADQKTLFLHESGHAIFGLIDTYCGSTEYRQNDPDPNVWSSQDRCIKAATNNSLDTAACRQIRQINPEDCTKPFWRWDPDPDIMHDGYHGVFGKVSTLRMTYTFNNIDAWENTP